MVSDRLCRRARVFRRCSRALFLFNVGVGRDDRAFCAGLLPERLGFGEGLMCMLGSTCFSRRDDVTYILQTEQG